MTRRVLLLVGSPKQVSTSGALGNYLLAQLSARGWETGGQHLHRAIRTAERWEALLGEVAAADVVVLTSPLYVDALPSGATEALERLARPESPKPQRFAAVLNSGFPEAQQSEIALAICRQFACEVGSAWLGGLALGGGPAIDGKDLERLGRVTRNVRRALELTAAALASDQMIPDTAVALMAKPLLPTWAYLTLGNWGWKRQARQHGARQRLQNKPYEPEREP
jgi:NAD(P)H-dependent FMN reductase